MLCNIFRIKHFWALFPKKCKKFRKKLKTYFIDTIYQPTLEGM